MAERIITGLKALDRKLRKLPRRPANRAARSGLKKGARLAAKEIKKNVPSRLKSVRKAIGWSVKKSKQGVTEAKAGAAVGKARKGTKPAKRSTRHGVGISRQNVHWWVLGTKRRRRKDGQSTGRMPRQNIVKNLNLVPIQRAVNDGTTAQMKRELAKL